MKLIALVDCNSFYCSCERIFRPDLINKPVVVLSNNDGCAISRTTEAKALGIEMGAPYFKIKKYCELKKIHIFSTNFSLYTDISRRVMNIIIEESPSAEVYSVDEAFIDVSGIKDIEEFSKRLKEKIYKKTKIPVSIGVGPTKALAKIANNLAKKSKKSKGIVILKEKRLQDVALARTPVEKIWGIGRANSEKMNRLGIKTAKDFRDYKNTKLIQKIFTKVGLQLQEELKGEIRFGLDYDITKKKEIMCSRTFGSTVNTKKDLKESVANYVSDVAKKIRDQGSLCTKITVFARTNPHNEEVPQYYMHGEKKLTNPTSNTFKLIEHALEIVELGYREGYAYKKAGVRISNFYGEKEYQIDLFEEQESEEEKKLMHVMDKLNNYNGNGTIKSLACGLNNDAFKMNRNHKSQRYTTHWDELMYFNQKTNIKK
jgi:DNA polymerase V